jgi:hypothetical protein
MFLFVMPDEIPQAVPLVRLQVDVVHARAQARLQVLGVAAEEVHDEAPGDRGEDGPGVVADGGRRGLLRHHGEAVAGLHGQPRQRQHHAREHVDDDLLVHARYLARPRPAAEYEVAAQEAGEETVVGSYIAAEQKGEVSILSSMSLYLLSSFPAKDSARIR